AVQNQQQPKDPRHNEPGILQSRVVEIGRVELRLAWVANILSTDVGKAGMQSSGSESGVVGLNHTFRVALADGCGVCVHGIQKELHRGGVAPLQVSVVVVRNDNSGIDLPKTD